MAPPEEEGETEQQAAGTAGEPRGAATAECACPHCAPPTPPAACRFTAAVEAAAEPSDEELREARRRYVARALAPWRATGAICARSALDLRAISARSALDLRAISSAVSSISARDLRTISAQSARDLGRHHGARRVARERAAARPGASPRAVNRRRAAPLRARACGVTRTRPPCLSAQWNVRYQLVRGRLYAVGGEPPPINHHHRKRMRGVRQVRSGTHWPPPPPPRLPPPARPCPVPRRQPAHAISARSPPDLPPQLVAAILADAARGAAPPLPPLDFVINYGDAPKAISPRSRRNPRAHSRPRRLAAVSPHPRPALSPTTSPPRPPVASPGPPPPARRRRRAAGPAIPTHQPERPASAGRLRGLPVRRARVRPRGAVRRHERLGEPALPRRR